MLTMLGSIAEFELEIMLERQLEGIAKAKAEGKYKVRKPTAQAKAKEVLQMKAEGTGATEIAKARNWQGQCLSNLRRGECGIVLITSVVYAPKRRK
tara:strand:- start:1065 stop:1352 length:288 start_codon:yes stop_codon:yes gene_type:complete